MTVSIEDLSAQFQKLLASDKPAAEDEEAARTTPQSEEAPTEGEPASEADAPAPPAPPSPVQVCDFAARGVHLDVSVSPEQVVAAAELMDGAGFALDAVTGLDWMNEEQMEVVYDFFHPMVSSRVAVRARIPRANPEIPTISNVFPGADWHERETHDFFGIRFLGHRGLIPLLLPEDSKDYHPLRKDFTA